MHFAVHVRSIFQKIGRPGGTIFVRPFIALDLPMRQVVGYPRHRL